MHPNAVWLAELDDLFDAGDMEAYFAGYASDVIVHVAGKSSLGGMVRGREAMVDVFQRFSERAETMKFERHAVLADDEHGLVLWRVALEREGAAFHGTETLIVHFSGGKIAEAWLDFEDRYAFDEFIG